MNTYTFDFSYCETGYKRVWKLLLLFTIFPSFCGSYLRWLWPGSGVDIWVWLRLEAILALEEKSPAPNAAGADAFRWCPCSGLPIPVEAQNWSTSRSSSLGKLKNKTTTEIERRQIERTCHCMKIVNRHEMLLISACYDNQLDFHGDWGGSSKSKDWLVNWLCRVCLSV